MTDRVGSNDGSDFVYRIMVGADAIDELDHVNNAVYLTWVQQAITAYWTHRAPAKYVDALAWIAQRHDITYRNEAFLGDRLEAKVALIGFRGSRALFRVRIDRDDTPVADVRTTLCCIDRATRRLHRIGPDLAAHFPQP